MSNTLSLQFIEEDIIADGETLDNRQITTALTYDLSVKYQTSIASDNTYVMMPFGAVASGLFFRVSTDQALSAKFNSDSTEYSLLGQTFSQMAITELQLKNNSGTVANVTFEVYGTE